MDITGMMKISVNELDRVVELIKNHKTFAISDAIDTTEIAQKVESIIESQAMRCRISTNRRSLALLLAIVPFSPAAIIGWLIALGIIIHNVSTINPDYEIIKCLIDKQVLVVYRK